MIWLAAACSGDPSEGTIVGNPGDTMTLVADGKGVTYTEADAIAVAWVMESCAGALEEIAIDEDIDLFGTVLETPAGTWCSTALEMVELSIEGEAGEDTFSVDLEGGLVELHSSEALEVDGHVFVLELGFPEWIDADDLGLRAGEHVEVDADHRVYEDLQRALLEASALYEDEDEDGRISDEERARGALAVGPSRRDDERERDATDTGDPDGSEDPDPGGCTSAPAAGGLLLALLALCRRREGSTPS